MEWWLERSGDSLSEFFPKCAALEVAAEIIVMLNPRDFPGAALAPHRVNTLNGITPDFVELELSQSQLEI